MNDSITDQDEPLDGPNRRMEPRMPFTGMRLKIRKRGVSKLRRYVECESIDLSNSGLAFSSASLALSELEKVDFILSFQNQTIHGVALVRYIHTQEERTQYGLMFLQAVPELDSVLAAEHLTTGEIKYLAGSMAEHLAYSIQNSQDRRLRFRRQQQRLIDALQAYFDRLAQMQIKLPDIHAPGDRWTLADDAVEIDAQKGNIRFIRYRADNDSFVEERISMDQERDADTSIRYLSSGGEIFHTLFELLSYISDEISLVAKLACLYDDHSAARPPDSG